MKAFLKETFDRETSKTLVLLACTCTIVFGIARALR